MKRLRCPSHFWFCWNMCIRSHIAQKQESWVKCGCIMNFGTRKAVLKEIIYREVVWDVGLTLCWESLLQKGLLLRWRSQGLNPEKWQFVPYLPNDESVHPRCFPSLYSLLFHWCGRGPGLEPAHPKRKQRAWRLWSRFWTRKRPKSCSWRQKLWGWVLLSSSIPHPSIPHPSVILLSCGYFIKG